MDLSRQDLRSTQPDRNNDFEEEWSAICLVTRVVVHGWAAMMYAFVRHSFGREFFNWYGMSGMLTLSVWSFVEPKEELLPYSIFMAAFVFLSLWHRFRSPRVFRDEVLHSRYIGWPLLCDLLPISERTAKCCIEPGVVLMIGGIVSLFNEGLGIFIALGSIACLMDWVFLHRRDYVRARRIHDAEKEHERAYQAYERYFKPKG